LLDPWLAWLAPAFGAPFSLLGSPVTWLEIVAFVLSLAMVVCNMRVLHWAWPLAIAASALYAALFAHSKLYGEAALQLFFIVISLWGWWQWWAKPAVQPQASGIRRMSKQQWMGSAFAGTGLVLGVGMVLSRFTDSDLPWADAVPTGLSVLGQVLLGKKFIENWAVWLVVNVLSCGLFAYKGLWLTVVLYALFALLSVVGFRAWQQRMKAPQ
jgi:nicotinamide mononucleotide transporter